MKKLILMGALACAFTFPSFAAVHAVSRTVNHIAHLSPIRAGKDLAFLAKKSVYPVRHPKKTAHGAITAGRQVF